MKEKCGAKLLTNSFLRGQKRRCRTVEDHHRALREADTFIQKLRSLKKKSPRFRKHERHKKKIQEVRAKAKRQTQVQKKRTKDYMIRKNLKRKGYVPEFEKCKKPGEFQ